MPNLGGKEALQVRRAFVWPPKRAEWPGHEVTNMISSQLCALTVALHSVWEVRPAGHPGQVPRLHCRCGG